MAILPDYWNIPSTTTEDMTRELDKRYWNSVDHQAIAERTSKLIEEARELHEAMLEYEVEGSEMENNMKALNELMWELSDVFAVFRHIEVKMLDNFGLKHDMIDWLEQKLAGMAVLKMEERDKNPKWGK